MLREAQQAVFVSDFVAENYHRRVFFHTPPMVLPNGVDPDVYYPVDAAQRRQLRAQFAIRDDQPVLLFCGRFIEKKGLATIERLTHMLPDWRFWLAGHGPLDPERWYRPNVHVFRGRSGASLADLYRTADLFILPSYGEGFPLVVQEAMACGLPVICSPSTSAGSQLAKPFLLTAPVDPSSPSRTASAWAKRLKAQREYLPLPESNPDLAAAAHYFWSWPKIGACYADLFSSLIKRRGS
jgi:glycosyltransferase involved in cell wall biosynthesis